MDLKSRKSYKDSTFQSTNQFGSQFGKDSSTQSTNQFGSQFGKDSTNQFGFGNGSQNTSINFGNKDSTSQNTNKFGTGFDSQFGNNTSGQFKFKTQFGDRKDNIPSFKFGSQKNTFGMTRKW